MAVWKAEGFEEAVESRNTEEGKNESESVSGVGQEPRASGPALTQDEVDRLGSEVLVSDFKQMKLEREAQKNWDLFYKRNSLKFFKDRHWTTREFEELRASREVRMIISSIQTSSRCN